MKLSDLTKKTKSATLVIDATTDPVENINFAYRYQLITPRMVSMVNALTGSDTNPSLDQVLQISGFVVQLIESWDITDDTGTAIALDLETVTNQVPLLIQFQLFGVMFEGMAGEATAGQASATPSV
jgi:hypothetical protein